MRHHAAERIHSRTPGQANPAATPPGQAGGRRLRPQQQADPARARPARVPEGFREVRADPPGGPGRGQRSHREGARPRDPDPSATAGTDPCRLLRRQPRREDHRRGSGPPDRRIRRGQAWRRRHPPADPRTSRGVSAHRHPRVFRGRPYPARGDRLRAPRLRHQRAQGRDVAHRPRGARAQDRGRGSGRRGGRSCRRRSRCRGRGRRRGRDSRRRGNSREEKVTPPPLAVVPGLDDTNLEYIVVAVIVFLVFVIGSRVVSTLVVAALKRRDIRSDMVQTGGRVVAFFLLGLGISFAIGFAFRSQNLTLAGILLATIIASFGVQDLLKDYVSGYYVLLERHIRVGDRITLEGVGSGTVTDVRLRVTLLKTDSGDLVVVPNSELLNKAVTVHVRAVERAAETKPTPPE